MSPRLIVNEQFACWTGEYVSILKAATRQGWLLPLLDSHWTPCEPDDAVRLIEWIRTEQIEGGLPDRLPIKWGIACGRARYNKRAKRYGISLPMKPGTSFAHLRAGLVLHEAAHIIDHTQHGRFGHQETFRRILRRLVEDDWRSQLSAGTQRDIYGRHPGPYSLLLSRAKPSKGGKVEEETEHVAGPFSAEEAHEEARMLVNDPRDNVASAHIFSNREGQFIGAFYKRGTEYASWEEMRSTDLEAAGFNDVKEEIDGRVELPDQREPAALLPRRQKPVRQVDDPVDPVVPARAVPTRRPVRAVSPQEQAAGGGRKRLLTLNAENTKDWPASKGAPIVRAALEAGLTGTASDIAKALAADLNAAGVEFPASLISRLKQGGFLREV